MGEPKRGVFWLVDNSILAFPFEADATVGVEFYSKRNTAVRPTTIGGITQRPDVDIIALTNHTINDDPQIVLDAVHTALKDIGYTDLTVNRRSVNVKLKKVDMDVVPIISDGYGGYLIPDIHLEEWLVTNPPAHTEWTVEVNKNANGRFKPLVKLFKWWRREE